MGGGEGKGMGWGGGGGGGGGGGKGLGVFFCLLSNTPVMPMILRLRSEIKRLHVF